MFNQPNGKLKLNNLPINIKIFQDLLPLVFIITLAPLDLNETKLCDFIFNKFINHLFYMGDLKFFF